eukprot:CAMPEP_0114972702 /NCGR_PEP_ID=MMETSP0216-20121206/543_1 /TAXON_ID=223996 /ORGANISM="Protocruzia adherens, Strain Boccale" /LENGTH=1068 /DNA_ID=CAMNT_0002333107 /DNA_START=672 /DNA_END=3879 /DNA_ORIENTATION=+
MARSWKFPVVSAIKMLTSKRSYDQQFDGQTHLLDEYHTNSTRSTRSTISSAQFEDPGERKLRGFPTVEMLDVTRKYNREVVGVDNLSLKFYPDQIFCLIGPNGAGKSSAIELIPGFGNLTQGSVHILGRNLATNLDSVRCKIAFCPQREILFESLNCWQHLELICRIKGYKGNLRVKEIRRVMEETDIEEYSNCLISEISGGTKRKLAIAIALIGNADILVFDEPTTGLDPISQTAIWQVLKRLKIGKTIIMTTNDMDEAEELADELESCPPGVWFAWDPQDTLNKKMIRDLIPSAKRNDLSSNSLNFLLPFEEAKNFPQLFESLETVGDIDITIDLNSLDEAFVNLYSKTDGTLGSLNRVGSSEDSEELHPNPTTLSSSSMLSDESCNFEVWDSEHNPFKQFKALFIKKCYESWRDWSFRIGLMVPILLVAGLAYVGKRLEEAHSQANLSIQINIFIVTFWVITFCYSVTLTTSFVVRESFSGLTHYLRTMGCYGTQYWCSQFIFDVLELVWQNLLLIVCLSVIYSGEDRFTSYGELFLVVSFSVLPTILAAHLFTFRKIKSEIAAFYIHNMILIILMFLVPLVCVACIFWFVLDENSSTAKWIQDFILCMSPVTVLYNAISTSTAKWIQDFILCLSPVTVLYNAISLQHTGVGGWTSRNAILDSTLKVILMQLIFTGIFSKILHRRLWAELKDTKKIQGGLSRKSPSPSVEQETNRVLIGNCRDPLTMKHISKVYPNDHLAINDLSLGCQKGEIVGLLGPSGSGKTTLFDLITSKIPLTKGKISLFRETVKTQNPNQFMEVGYCPQSDPCFRYLTVRQHLELVFDIKNYQAPDRKRFVDVMLEMFQLSIYQGKRLTELSGGNRRKVSLAMALMSGPKVILLDEPFNGIDPLTKKHLKVILRQIAHSIKSTILLSTHMMEDAESLCDRLAFLIHGKLCTLGTPQKIVEEYAGGYIVNVYPLRSVSDNGFSVTTSLKNVVPDIIRMPDSKFESVIQFLLRAENNNASVRFSTLFSHLEKLRSTGLIEDYAIKRNSLHQAFVSFIESESMTCESYSHPASLEIETEMKC